MGPTTTPDLPVDTLVHRIARWAKHTPDSPATHVKRGAGFETRTWAQHWDAVQGVGRALLAAGHRPGDAVAILAGNTPEWVQAQFGVQAAGGIVAPIYTTSTTEQTAYIVANSGARIAFCDSAAQLDKLLAAERDGLCPRFEALVVFGEADAHGGASEPDPRVHVFGPWCAADDHHAAQASDLQARIDALTPEGTCLLIYTSGTTGVPKGVMLGHAGQLMACNSVLEEFSIFKQAPYRVVSYLPLSHQTEQLVTNVGGIITGGEVYFCPEVSMVREYLGVARPTLFMGVPRVWEKFEAALRARLAETTGLKGKLAAWALATELRGFERDCETGGYHDSLPRRIARKLVVDKIKGQLGLDALLVAFTGSAPMGKSTARFFGSLGIAVHEGYGLTETSGLATTHRYGRPRAGTVGAALSCCELSIADDGEILVRGPNVTRGYLNMPEESRELFTEGGFMRTGDLGEVDAQGELRITGRKKEILITAGAKNVAPAELEHLVQTIDGVGQAVVVGDGEPYLSVLLTLDPERLDALGAAAGSSARDMAGLAADPAVEKHLQGAVQTHCNDQVARYQTLKKLAVLPAEFSVEGGELTPSMKLRRKEIHAKYATLIADFYRDKNAGISAA